MCGVWKVQRIDAIKRIMQKKSANFDAGKVLVNSFKYHFMEIKVNLLHSRSVLLSLEDTVYKLIPIVNR